jgi:tetratricopeptide (TPR) repeat protein
MSTSTFSADHLFGPAAPAYSMRGCLPALERATRQPDETRAAVALTAFALSRLIARFLARDSAAAAGIELDREVAAIRAQVRTLPPLDSEVVHLERILVALEAEPAAGPLGNQLAGYAACLEQQAQLEEALAAVAMAARAYGSGITTDEYVACALTAGRLNRLLARWEAAATCYEAAELTGRSSGDVVSALRGRLGRGAVARGRGDLPTARAIAQEVQGEARALHLPRVEALACADLAAAYSELGMPLEALQADYRAFELAPDSEQRLRALGNLGTDLVNLGSYDGARVAFSLVAASDAKATVRLNALVELVGIEGAVGDQAVFERHRRTAENRRDQMPPSMAVDFLFKQAAGFDRFGNRSRAHAALDEAQSLAAEHELHAWEFRIEHALQALDQSAEQRFPETAPTPLRDVPVVRRVAAGLQEYAAQLA